MRVFCKIYDCKIEKLMLNSHWSELEVEGGSVLTFIFLRNLLKLNGNLFFSLVLSLGAGVS